MATGQIACSVPVDTALVNPVQGGVFDQEVSCADFGRPFSASPALMSGYGHSNLD